MNTAVHDTYLMKGATAELLFASTTPDKVPRFLEGMCIDDDYYLRCCIGVEKPFNVFEFHELVSIQTESSGLLPPNNLGGCNPGCGEHGPVQSNTQAHHLQRD